MCKLGTRGKKKRGEREREREGDILGVIGFWSEFSRPSLAIPEKSRELTDTLFPLGGKREISFRKRGERKAMEVELR